MVTSGLYAVTKPFLDGASSVPSVRPENGQRRRQYNSRGPVLKRIHGSRLMAKLYGSFPPVEAVPDVARNWTFGERSVIRTEAGKILNACLNQ
jgi:hypothetical protein